jgi:ATP-dependent Lon protease
MQTGKFTRGDLEFSTQASIVLAGNIDCDIERKKPADHYLHLFAVLPEELGADAAFLDRLNGFLPGWEMPKIRPENYAKGYGFVTDYLAEIFTRLRRRNFQTIVDAHVNFGSMTGRNQDSIKKTTAGLLKLIFPHKAPNTIEWQELESCLDLAIECRQRILDQLAISSPEEFKLQNLKEFIQRKPNNVLSIE